MKPANQFQLEKRPAPPVYQPQQANTSSQPKAPSSSAQPQSHYQLSSPVWVGNGRQQIRVTAKGSPMPIGSVDVHYKQGGKAYISDLEVSQSHRRHGVGTMLMKAAMDAARRNGSSATELEAKPGPGSISNQALSGMYQKLGFRNAGASSRGNPKMLANAAVQQKPAVASPGTTMPPLPAQNSSGGFAAITRRVMQPCSGFPKPVSTLPSWVIQRSAMEIETKDEESESETELEDGVRVEKSSDAISDSIVAEVEKIIKAASDKGGGARDDNGGLDQLKTILADKAVTAAKPKNSEGTYAIGSDGATLYLTGTQKFVTAAKSAAGGVATQDIGARDDFIHGESHLLQSKPAIRSVAATQPNCLFCYGFLETKKLDHQELRAKPFPKGWIHPTGGFKLTNVNPSNGPKGKLLWIVFNGAERLYRVD